MAGIGKYAENELTKLADPVKAASMAAYMRTDTPFFGVQKKERTMVLEKLMEKYPAFNEKIYREHILELWHMPGREEKYLAIAYARKYPQFMTPASLPLFERLIREGDWWDFVDEIAQHCIGYILFEHKENVALIMHQWVNDENVWKRRTALICQNRLKERTDRGMLFGFCLKRAHEKEDLIRKAIGWALREYSKSNPEAVLDFLKANGDKLSGLSYREASKVLRKKKLID
jgi:3-methyladenine DNA glycosylase AlkD